MAKKDAIVYFITDEERAAAKQAMPDASETESFLVGQLDPDWNVLLPELSERIIGEQVGDSYFKHALKGHPKPANEGHLKTGQRVSPGH